MAKKEQTKLPEQPEPKVKSPTYALLNKAQRVAVVNTNAGRTLRVQPRETAVLLAGEETSEEIIGQVQLKQLVLLQQ
jgi:hypothetical protein